MLADEQQPGIFAPILNHATALQGARCMVIAHIANVTWSPEAVLCALHLRT